MGIELIYVKRKKTDSNIDLNLYVSVYICVCSSVFVYVIMCESVYVHVSVRLCV